MVCTYAVCNAFDTAIWSCWATPKTFRRNSRECRSSTCTCVRICSYVSAQVPCIRYRLIYIASIHRRKKRSRATSTYMYASNLFALRFSGDAPDFCSHLWDSIFRETVSMSYVSACDSMHLGTTRQTTWDLLLCREMVWIVILFVCVAIRCALYVHGILLRSHGSWKEYLTHLPSLCRRRLELLSTNPTIGIRTKSY